MIRKTLLILLFFAGFAIADTPVSWQDLRRKGNFDIDEFDTDDLIRTCTF